MNRWTIVSGIVLALLVAPFAFASGEGKPVNGGARNPSSNKSREYTKETQIIAQTSTYGTRQSNKGSGGGAVYGCRSVPGAEACLSANNLRTGRAFQFKTEGTEGGFIEVGAGSTNTKTVPFKTNAAAKVANLNADKVDDLSSEEIVAQARPLWAVVASDGTLGRKNGASSASRSAAGEYQVVFGRDVSGCAYDGTIGSGDSAEPPAGEIGVAQAAGNASAVSVVTRDSAGAKADRPFHLSVNC
jgi:hypothetical protein